MPNILKVGSHRFFFFSNEGNEPAHIHVRTGENFAKFWLIPVTLADGVGYNAKELRELREIVENHVEFFKEKWDEYFVNP